MEHSPDRAALADAAARDLCDASAAARGAALERLEALYVSCEGGTCTIDPAVARAALPHLIRALGDPDPEVRVTGAHAAELFGGEAREAVEQLAGALVDPVTAVRIAALDALCAAGVSAAPAARSIAERLAHAPTPEERSAAGSALGSVGVPVDCLDAIFDALLGDEDVVQEGAAYALWRALDERSACRREASQRLRRLSGRT